MAKAIRHEAVTKVVEPERVVLELSADEVDFLVAVLAKVGGSPDRSPRKFEVSISKALRAADVPTYLRNRAYPLLDGNVHFRPSSDLDLPED